MAKELSKFAHPDYVANLPTWTKIRDCYDGERAIKSKGATYLPRLTNQSELDYSNYLGRALFFPITGKTCSSMVGLATSKPPQISAPELMSRYFSDTDTSQYQFTEFYLRAFNELVLQGRVGILIDAPADHVGDPEPVTYIAENIVNWREERGQLTMVLLREFVEVRKADDDFETGIECRYRHCFLRDGVYRQQLLDEDLKPVGGVITPTFSGVETDKIPFFCIGSTGVHMWVDKPPMQDIATINISHYLTSADLEWGRHIVGLPTPVVSGVDAGTKLSIGGTAAWILPPAEAKAYYMEFLGQGLGSLEKAMTEKISLMSAMSARLVDSSSRGSEAAEAVRLRYVNEAASLIHIVGSMETGLNLVFNTISDLMLTSEVLIQLPRDVLNAGLTFADMKVLFEAYFKGGISKEALVYNLRRLEALDPNRTDAQELAAIKDPTKIQPQTKPAADPVGTTD